MASTDLQRSTGAAGLPPAAAEEAFWARVLPKQPFYVDGLSWSDYAPAFRLACQRWRDDTLVDDVIARLGGEWNEIKGDSRLAWYEAHHAVRAAWERLERQRQQQRQPEQNG